MGSSTWRAADDAGWADGSARNPGEIQERFVLPPSIVYQPGMIIDQAAGILIVGWNRVFLDDGIHPVSVWEERGRPEIPAEPPPDQTLPAVIARMPPLEGPASLRGALLALLRGGHYSRRVRIGRAVLLGYDELSDLNGELRCIELWEDRRAE